MSLVAIEKEVAKFLQSSEPEVLCIRGNWGTGKTHAWQRLFKKGVEQKTVALKRYAYCSLFGLNSLAELKQAIVENTIKGESLADPPSTATFFDNAKDALGRWGEKGLRHTKNAAQVGLEIAGAKSSGELIATSMFLAVRNQIVCIDDIERKGAHLHVSDVLGLLSMLKEQRNCKAVLIYNDRQLREQEDFERYLEKVVDVSLAFAPTPEECADIVLSRQRPPEAILHRYCTALSITNIRVIERTKKLAESIDHLFKGRDRRVLDEALKTLMLLSWVTFIPDDAPPIDFIRNRTQRRIAAMVRGGRNESQSTDPRHESWHALLDQIGSNTLSQLDETLLMGVQQGYFDEQAIADLAARFEQQMHDNDAEAAFSRAWDKYHGSFHDNEADLAAEFIAAVRGAVDFISPSNLSSTIGLLRKLDRSNEADELIDYYMTHRTANALFFRLDPEHPWEDVRDEKLLAAFRKRAASFKDERGAAEILTQIADGAASTIEWERLAQFSPEELRGGFRQLEGRTLRQALENASRPSRQAVNGRTIADNVKAALELIGKENRLNGLRATSKLGSLQR